MRIFLTLILPACLFGIVPSVSTGAVFLPGGDGEWNLPGNWNTGVVPNNVDETAIVSMNAAVDRSVLLTAPVIIGELILNHGTAFRDRIEGASLTFASTTGEASVVVNGNGTGFHELELKEGFLTLHSSLRVTVNNVASDGEFGALRIRQAMQGSGGLIKDGYGVLSLTGGDKNYTGPTTIEEGILRITQSAQLEDSESISVEPGGQLRLVSHGLGHVYSFGGRLYLNSLGPIEGPVLVPQGGRLGALRLDSELETRQYEDGDDPQTGTITTEVEFVGDSHVHVDGSNNQLTLSGAIFGAGDLYKSGGGELVLAGNNVAFEGGTHVESGTVRVEAGSSLGTGDLTFEGIEDDGLDLILSNAAQTVSLLQSDLTGSSTAVVTLGAGHELTVDQDTESSFEGSLTGFGSFSKAGEGTLVLSGEQSLTGAISVNEGTLQIDGGAATASGVTVASGAQLAGTGLVSTVSGGGTVSPGDGSGGILGALAFDGSAGLDVVFDFAQTGSPLYANPAASGNDVLRLSGLAPFGSALDGDNTISVYLDVDDVGEADLFRGGFFTNASDDFHAEIQDADLRVYVRDAEGMQMHNALAYRPYDGPLSAILNTVPENGGRVMELSWTSGGSGGDFAGWQDEHFPDPDDRNDPAISGPEADANGDGVSNLVAYALGLGPREKVGEDRLRTVMDETGRLAVRFYLDAARTDIAYIVETSTDLFDWEAVFDSREFAGPNSAGELHEVFVPAEAGSEDVPSRFVRLRVQALP